MKPTPTARTFRLLTALAASVCLAGCDRKPAKAGQTSPPGAKVDYGRDVQPILSNYCYHCHGPDTASRKAGLRLDLREKALAFKNKEGKRTIVPGKPEESELVRRIESHDPDAMMPQDKEKLLNAAQIRLLRDWIAQGAEFRDHWAFEPPAKAKLPEVSNPAWCKTDLDRFILAKLDAEKLKPNAEADRATLIRRVTLDLTGLLPTPAEVEAFVADAAPTDAAYEKVVDRLLAGPRYGEHRARHWLDYARYGDTHGIQNDKTRGIWPWRDYVIRAFNDDKPYDQFTREQLAGDLLPAETVDQLVATGFVRNGISTGEGGTFLEELRVNNARERVENFGAVYLGMTTGCAACHDHKYDPVTQKDFYALTAFFNNLEELPSNDDRYEWPPFLRIPPAQNTAAYNALLVKKAAVQRGIEAHRQSVEKLLAGWQAKGGTAKTVSGDGLVLHLRLDENGAAGAGTFKNSAPGAADTFTATGASPAWGEESWLWPAFRLASNTRAEMGQIGDFERTQAFSGGGWVKPKPAAASSPGATTGALLAKMDGGGAYRGWNLLCENGAATVQLIGTWPSDALSVTTTSSALLPRGRWSHVFFTYDGSGKAAGVKIYADGKEQPVKVNVDALASTIRTESPLALGRRNNNAAILTDSSYQDMRLYRRALTADEAARLPHEDLVAPILQKAPAQWSADERFIATQFCFSRVDDQLKGLQAEVAALDAQLAPLENGGQVTLICREADGRPFADVLSRGGFAARIGRVEPETPHFLPPMPPSAPHNRKGLADWVVSPQNPLTARVAVNRAWQELFGLGLVESSEDFGVVGQRPINQPLLDFLAVDFREQGWSLKRIYRQMVLSAAYRQDAKAPPAAFARDPKNQLLARGPRFRMDAEMLRDSALQASGLLVEKQGGPSVKPYQPPGVWEAGGQDPAASDTTNYRQDHGENLYRRSLYTFWKRQAMMPNMEVFDAPDREMTCTRRPRTNTPLAALVLFNDVQWLEAARFLGLRAIREGGASDDTKLAFLGRTVLARGLSLEETADLKKALSVFRGTFTTKPAEAAELLKQGEKAKASDLPDAEQAAWMMVAHQCFNLDEFLNK